MFGRGPLLGTATIALAAALACGGAEVRRPIDLLLGGLSVRAERLVILIVPASDGLSCDDVTLDSAPGVEGIHRAEWARASAPDDRAVTLPDVAEEAVTFVAYAEDAAGRVIQVACSQIEYADLESPDVSLQLSPAPRE